MKGNVNPFEPWRPVEVRIPQPIHASRPWRPPPPPPARPAVEEPPFVEPVKPLPRNKPPERLPRAKQPPCRADQPSWARTPIPQLLAVIVFAMLGVVCLDSVGWLRGTHMPRLMALGASAGLFLGMALNARRSWYTRLRGMAISMALAGIALWFVPTLHGVSLWSAYRQVERLRTLAPGAVVAYQRHTQERKTLVEEFPSFVADVSAAERAWFRRTVDEAIENADRKLEIDPQSAFRDLHGLHGELTRLEHLASVQKELGQLEAARQRAMQASAKAVHREVKNEKLGRR